MKKTARLLGTLALLLIAVLPALAGRLALAEEDWKTEFDSICSKTTDAMALPGTEVRALIERCDRLRPRIEKLGESEAKVYLKRLRMCKDLFVFALENPRK